MSNEHTPTTGEVRLNYAYLGGTVGEREFDRRAENFDRWYAAEFGRIIAAAEQRGAEQERKDIVGSLIDWDVIYGHEEGTPETHESHRIAAWIDDRADRIAEPEEA